MIIHDDFEDGRHLVGRKRWNDAFGDYRIVTNFIFSITTDIPCHQVRTTQRRKAEGLRKLRMRYVFALQSALDDCVTRACLWNPLMSRRRRRRQPMPPKRLKKLRAGKMEVG